MNHRQLATAGGVAVACIALTACGHAPSTGEATGESRAVDAARLAIASPLLDIDINGARGVLFNITGGLDLTLYEVNEAADIISKAAHPEANIIFGAVQDPAYDGKVKITVIATGFDARPVVVGQQSRVDYGRGASHPYHPVAPSTGINSNGAYRQQVQGYNPLPVTPPPVNNIARRPTGPLPAAPRSIPQQMAAVPVMQEPARQPVSAMQPMPPVRDDVSDDDYDLDDNTDDMEDLMPPARLPVPEPEAQPAQRPAADGRQQRPIRRMDPKALDLPRGVRNAPPGDVIDIPAFLRKR